MTLYYHNIIIFGVKIMNARMKSFLKKSEAEYNKYKTTKDDVYLAQAGEKLWNIFNMYVQEKVGRKITNYGALKKAVSELFASGGTNNLLTTFKNTYDLHVFFYRGWTEDINEIDELYLESKNGLALLGVSA